MRVKKFYMRAPASRRKAKFYKRRWRRGRGHVMEVRGRVRRRYRPQRYKIFHVRHRRSDLDNTLVMASRVAAEFITKEFPYSWSPVEVEPSEHPDFVGYVDFQGLDIDLENLAGDVRSGVDPQGNSWEAETIAHYGEIRGTEGVDGDLLDVYVGPNHDSPTVVVIHQHTPDTGKYDEDKVMVGWDSVDHAVQAYKTQYKKPGFYVGLHTAINIGQFWRWVNDVRNKGQRITDDSATQNTSEDEVPVCGCGYPMDSCRCALGWACPACGAHGLDEAGQRTVSDRTRSEEALEDMERARASHKY